MIKTGLTVGLMCLGLGVLADDDFLAYRKAAEAYAATGGDDADYQAQAEACANAFDADIADKEKILNSLSSSDRASFETMKNEAASFAETFSKHYDAQSLDGREHLTQADTQCFENAKANAIRYAQTHMDKHLDSRVAAHTKSTHQIFVFLTLSMPDIALKAYIKDAKAIGAVPVIKGMINNNPTQTLKRVSELVKDNHEGGVAIDPILFQNYEIDRVPALVVTDKIGPSEFHNKVGFDVVKGNIGLLSGLEVLSKSQSRGEFAAAKAKALQGAV